MRRKDLNKVKLNRDTPRRYLEDFRRRHPAMYYVVFDIIALTIIGFILVFAWFGFCQFLVHLNM